MYQWLKDFEQNPPGPRDPIYLGEMLDLFSSNLDRIAALIQTEPIPPPHVTPIFWGSQDLSYLN